MSDENRPKSATRLKREIQRRLNALPPDRQSVAYQNIQNAILAQFLGENVMIKGGSAISLRYPLAEGRKSRDFDLSINISQDLFANALSLSLHEGWEGFTGTIEPETRPKGLMSSRC